MFCLQMPPVFSDYKKTFWFESHHNIFDTLRVLQKYVKSQESY